ncbi:hypothetical protein GGS26DRAFT_593418 [Hypomontagnella submonticulosa]|nr:hypothetical protein GGS26DRAFT_593418 [Hypomontagnella submonticulosa]
MSLQESTTVRSASPPGRSGWVRQIYDTTPGSDNPDHLRTLAEALHNETRKEREREAAGNIDFQIPAFNIDEHWQRAILIINRPQALWMKAREGSWLCIGMYNLNILNSLQKDMAMITKN